jgi:hypothetical protein
MPIIQTYKLIDDINPQDIMHFHSTTLQCATS